MGWTGIYNQLMGSSKIMNAQHMNCIGPLHIAVGIFQGWSAGTPVATPQRSAAAIDVLPRLILGLTLLRGVE